MNTLISLLETLISFALLLFIASSTEWMQLGESHWGLFRACVGVPSGHNNSAALACWPTVTTLHLATHDSSAAIAQARASQAFLVLVIIAQCLLAVILTCRTLMWCWQDLERLKALVDAVPLAVDVSLCCTSLCCMIIVVAAGATLRDTVCEAALEGGHDVDCSLGTSFDCALVVCVFCVFECASAVYGTCCSEPDAPPNGDVVDMEPPSPNVDTPAEPPAIPTTSAATQVPETWISYTPFERVVGVVMFAQRSTPQVDELAVVGQLIGNTAGGLHALQPPPPPPSSVVADVHPDNVPPISPRRVDQDRSHRYIVSVDTQLPPLPRAPQLQPLPHNSTTATDNGNDR